jgi:hypothetical protein
LRRTILGIGEIKRTTSMAKLAGAGIISLVIGLPMVFSGDKQSMIAGAGATCAGVAIFVLIFAAEIWRSRRPAPSTHKSEATGIIWTGIALTLIPIPIYYYLKTAMPLFEPEKAVIPCVAILAAGVGCIGIGLFTSIAKR